MGLFKRGHRVAEGGGGAYEASGDKAKASDDLALFGADSDESDDDATIDRYANGGGDGDESKETQDGAAGGESKNVSALLSKMTPEELFQRFDTDSSGNISIAEFLAMLPELGIKMSQAKAMRIFKKCDSDGTGEIDLNEFQMAMFAVDPVSGNTLGFAPSQLLAPRDAFELFDEDGTGQIDELEFADVLEYFGMDVSDGKQEAMFKKYDKDKSGFIDYNEFRSMWIRLSNVREELEKRGVEIPKYATPWKLQHMLEALLDEEEAKEALVLKEAKKFLEKQREKQRRERLGRRAVVRAQDELAAALDAAGQVYVLGTGKYQQFTGLAVVRDEELYPGFKAVSEIWGFRVDPKESPPALKSLVEIPSVPDPKPTREQKQQQQQAIKKLEKEARTKEQQHQAEQAALLKRNRYVRRRPENKRWTFRSPPKLNTQTMTTLKGQIRLHEQQQEQVNTGKDTNNEWNDASIATKEPQPTMVTALALTEGSSSSDTDEEALARLFYQDRELVRSLRFRSTVIMKNTGALWGRGVLCGALSDDVALAVAGNGSVFTWGGKDRPRDSALMQRIALLNTVDDDAGEDEDHEGVEGKDAGKTKLVHVETDRLRVEEKVTPRSAMVKMSTKHQLAEMEGDVELEMREEERVEAELRQREDDERYAQLKSVVVYYDKWEPPPSHATRGLFMEHVLVPRLDYESMQKSAQWRGLGEIVARITKMELMVLLAECFALERDVKGEIGHEAIKTQEKVVQELDDAKDKKSKLQLEPEKLKLLQMWEDLLRIRIERRAQVKDNQKRKEIEQLQRTDTVFEAAVARRSVQSEDLTPEFTARGTNKCVEISGITTRGPALHSPRGDVAVASIVAGGSHAAILMHDGSVYTWGIGSNGRLGHTKAHAKQLTFDSNHPQLVDAFRDSPIRHMSCGFSHSAAVSVNGELFTWGSAIQGKLGVGLVEDKYEQFATEPLVVKFPGRRSIRSVSCGASHTGAVSTHGELFMWGSANGGRLGLGAHVADVVVVPTLVKDLVSRKLRVWQVACGSAHSAFCTETTSEFSGGDKKLQGGHVYVCGGATPLGRHVPSWELVVKLRDSSVAIKQVSCGVGHTAAVSAYGELYTWGRNAQGCTGHSVDRKFIAEPELVRSLHVEPFNLALGKKCQQINVYNEQGPERAVNGDVDGRLEKCIHTHLEEKPWWQVDLGQPAVIERIRVWNRSDEPSNPSKPRTEYTGRLFPFWILVSEFPFKDLEGKEGLRAAKVQSSAFEQFGDNTKRMTEWLLPTAQTVGQYVRIQLQGRNFLHLAEVEVFGVYSAFNYVGRVGAAHCGNEATLVVVPPIPQQSALDDYYLRAIRADADNATILRQFAAYEASYRTFGRDGDRSSRGKDDQEEDDGTRGRIACRLCRVFRECEICEFYSQADIGKGGGVHLRLVGDRMGLSDLVKLAVDETGLDHDAQELEQDAAQRAAHEAAAEAEAAASAKKIKISAPAILQKVRVLPGPMRKFTAAFPLRKSNDGQM